MASFTTEFYSNTTTNPSKCLVLKVQEFIPWNNSDNIVSLQTRVIVRKVNLVILAIACLLGVPANIINMLVFYKHGLKERINVCLFALSMADGLFLVICILNSGEQLYIHFATKQRFGHVKQWLTNHRITAFYGFSWVSQVLSAIVASERCFCILQPLKSKTILRSFTMTVIVVAVSVVLIGLRVLISARYYITCAIVPPTNNIITTAIGSEFYFRHKKLIDLVDIVVFGLGVPWVVIIGVMVTTIITVFKLRQAAEWRTGTSSSSDSVSARDIALTRMLVANSVLFIVCVFPNCLFRTSLLFLPEMSAGRRHHNMFLSGLSLSEIFFYINSTFNIVIYYTMGSRYRHTFHTLLASNCTKGTPNEKPKSTPNEKLNVKAVHTNIVVD